VVTAASKLCERRSSESTDTFSTNFLITLAREISIHRSKFNVHHSNLRNLDILDTWLNDPVLVSGGGGLTILGIGGTGNISRNVNTGQGFARGGLEAHLREIMSVIFPQPRSGYGIHTFDWAADWAARAKPAAIAANCAHPARMVLGPGGL